MSPWKIGEIFCFHLARAFHAVDFGMRRPGSLRLISRLTEQLPMSLGFRYTVALPPISPADFDVATRELSVSLDGSSSIVTGTPTDATLPVEARLGQHVILTLTDVDGAGNRSEPSPTLEFDAADTVAPHQPGGLAVQGIEQIEIPDV